MKRYDVCIIGGGPAGSKSAKILAKAGKRVCLVEKSEASLGGTCLNEGCIPTKNYLQSSEYIKKASYFANQGVDVNINGLNLSQLKEKTKNLLSLLRGGIIKGLKENSVDLFFGEASFVSKNEIVLDSDKERISADIFIIATGSSHKEHPLLKVDDNFIISSKEVFSLEELPKDLLIVGAGVIGCEFATFFNSVGVNVHLAEFTPSILPLEDEDVSKTILREFKKQKIKVDVSINAVSYEIKDGKIEVTFESKKGVESKAYDKVLISIGRVPNTSSLGLDRASVETDERGFVKVDENFQTSNPNIYAIGDVVNTPALAHVAYFEAKVVCDFILETKREKLNPVVPNVVFTSPQVGSTGKKERELKEEGISYGVEKLFFKSLGMPKIKGDDSGFFKLLLDSEKNILGCAIVGYDATETINQVALAINSNKSTDDIKQMIFAHPTISESFLEIAESI